MHLKLVAPFSWNHDGLDLHRTAESERKKERKKERTMKIANTEVEWLSETVLQ